MNTSRRFINILWQWAFLVAYQLIRLSWFVFRPASSGTCVLVWHEGRVLAIRNSYKFEYTVPGGNVGTHESPQDAAARELFEEVGIRVWPESLRFLGQFLQSLEYKKDVVSLFEVEFDTEPAVQIDHREVVWAGFMTPEELLRKKLFVVVRRYLLKISG